MNRKDHAGALLRLRPIGILISVAVCISFGQTSPGEKSFFTSSSQIGLPRGAHSVLDSAQAEWVRYYSSAALKGYAEAGAVASDLQGNIYVAGKGENPVTSYDYQTTKYNSTGAELWSASYDGPAHGFDAANAIVVDNAGNVYVTGVSSGTSGFDYATVKYNSAGQELWVARYNSTGDAGDDATAIAIDSDGNVYVTGESARTRSGNYSRDYDIATVKYNNQGIEQWVDRYAGAAQYDDQPVGIRCGHAGDLYVVGESCDSIWFSSSPYFSLYSTVVLKYSPSGNRQWTVRYTQADTISATPSDFSMDDSDNVIITGRVRNARNYWWSDSPDTCMTIKYNTAGVLQWSTLVPDPQTQRTIGERTATDLAGNVYVLGRFGSPYWYISADSLFLSKLSPTGQLQWTSLIHDTDPMAPVDVALDPTGSPYVTWMAVRSYDYDKYRVIRTALFSSVGNEEWRASYDTRTEPPYNNNVVAGATVADLNGNLHIVGGTGGDQANDMVMLKYAPNGIRKWVHTKRGTRSWDQVYAMTVGDSNNVYVTGTSVTGGFTSDILTVKYSATGDVQWSSRYRDTSYSHTSPCALRIDRSGNVYVLATEDSVDWNTGRVSLLVVVKYDPTGHQEWAAKYVSSFNHLMFAVDMGIDLTGDIVVAGYRYWYPQIQYVTVKYSPLGDQLWVATFDSAQGEGTTALAVDDSNNVIVAGGRRIVKYDEAGNERWVYAGGAKAITVDNACNVYITSDTGSTRKLSPAGTSMWSVPFAGNAIALDGSGNVLVRNSAGGLAKISTGGATLWNLPITDCLGSYMALDNSGNAYIAGIHITPLAVEYQTRAFDQGGTQRWSTGFEDNGANSWYQYPIAVSNQGDVFVGAVSQTGSSSVFKTIKYRQIETSVRDDGGEIPQAFSLSQNYPNPFNPSTTIRFALPKSGRIELKVYNALGQEVATLVNEDKAAGTYSLQWNAGELASGVYFYRLKAGEYTDTRKLLLLK